MKFSQLPKQYQDLEKDFRIEADVDKDFDDLLLRFFFQNTPQGHNFWRQCATALTNEDLPKIPE
jgi:hypothetical protein